MNVIIVEEKAGFYIQTIQDSGHSDISVNCCAPFTHTSGSTKNLKTDILGLNIEFAMEKFPDLSVLSFIICNMALLIKVSSQDCHEG